MRTGSQGENRRYGSAELDFRTKTVSYTTNQIQKGIKARWQLMWHLECDSRTQLQLTSLFLLNDIMHFNSFILKV